MQTTVKAHPTALIAQDATLSGTITIGAGCIIHPRASILATTGPIELGKNCVIEELAVIENTGRPGEEGEDLVLRIGHNNQFSVGCRASLRQLQHRSSCLAELTRTDIQARSIGDDNTFHPRSRVPSSIAVSQHCTVQAGVTVSPSAHAESGGIDELAPYTVVYGSMAERRLANPTEKDGRLGAIQEVEDRVRRDKLAFLREHLPR
jgi:dynactin-6